MLTETFGQRLFWIGISLIGLATGWSLWKSF